MTTKLPSSAKSSSSGCDSAIRARDPVNIWVLKSNSGGGGLIETFVRILCLLVGLIVVRLLGFGVEIRDGDLRSFICSGWLWWFGFRW
ncbi:hypothetical protein Hanom_Chr13g01189581 [Helianthus anomalus]